MLGTFFSKARKFNARVQSKCSTVTAHSAHHFYNFNQLVSGFIAQNKKVTNNVHLMTFENLETCGNLWGNNSNSTHVDWWTAKHHFSRPRHKQDCNPRHLLPVSRLGITPNDGYYKTVPYFIITVKPH